MHFCEWLVFFFFCCFDYSVRETHHACLSQTQDKVAPLQEGQLKDYSD